MDKKSNTIAFLIDCVLSTVPAINYHILHDGNVAMLVVYFVMFYLLRQVDTVMVSKSFSVWKRAIIKLVILVVADGLVLVSGIEKCDLPGTNCARLFF